MKVQVYGVQKCKKCQNVIDVIKAFLVDYSIGAEVEHINDLGKLAEAGILMTPGIAVDGKVVSQGKVPAEQDLKEWFGVD
ncbi:MAG TPA: thioredoxin family protein [Atribacteraceae bacterium]|nr:thioredoxin family protein [Atribacteraceae bacterium]